MEKDVLRDQSFSKEEHIRCSLEIRNIFKTGRKVSTLGAKLFFVPGETEKNRIAFVLPRHYGTAVKRNKSKRISREAYRLLKSDMNLKKGYDFLLLIYPGGDSFSLRKKQLSYLFSKAGLCC